METKIKNYSPLEGTLTACFGAAGGLIASGIATYFLINEPDKLNEFGDAKGLVPYFSAITASIICAPIGRGIEIIIRNIKGYDLSSMVDMGDI